MEDRIKMEGRICVDYIDIKFQVRSIKEAGINGCQIEDILDILIIRLEYLQKELPCKENEDALFSLKKAKTFLVDRTLKRKEQGIEGTNKPHES